MSMLAIHPPPTLRLEVGVFSPILDKNYRKRAEKAPCRDETALLNLFFQAVKLFKKYRRVAD